MGESSRAGARRSLPLIVEDDEEEEGGDEQGDHDEEDAAYDADADADEDEDEDEEQQLQRAIKMSLEGASPAQEARTFDAQGFDQQDTALAFEASVREMHRRSEDFEPEDIYTAMDDGATAPERESEPEMYGPGDYKGKGRAVEPRKFDDFAEDEEDAEREGSPSKRPRGSK